MPQACSLSLVRCNNPMRKANHSQVTDEDTTLSRFLGDEYKLLASGGMSEICSETAWP